MRLVAPRRAAGVIAIASLALLSACGGGGSDASEGGAGGPATTTTAGEAGGGGGAEVSIVDFAFDPTPLEVEPGTTVTFTNDDSAAHTATSSDGAPAEFDTGKVEGDASAEVTLDEPGDYEYHCSIHDYMKGTVRVLG